MWRSRAIVSRGDVPIRAYHGAHDDIVPLGEVEALMSEHQRHGGEGKLIIFPEGKHDIWDMAYQDAALYRDFLPSCNRRTK
jgi:predicted esterase